MQQAKEKWCIYMHRNKINNKVYIGLTKCSNPNDRWRNGTHYEETYFGRAINKYGWDNFEHIILEDNIPSLEEANAKEVYYISYFNANDHEYGYNSTSGGDSYQLNEDARRRRGELLKLLWEDPVYRQHHSDRMKQYWQEHPELLDERGQTVKCVETGEIFSCYRLAGEWCGLQQYKNNFLMYFRGERHSCGKHPETGEPLHWIKIDKNNQEVVGIQNFDAKKSDPSYRGGIKAVRCIETGEVFDSLQKAADWCHLASSSSITNVLKGRKRSAGKHPITKEPLHWEYVK